MQLYFDVTVPLFLESLTHSSYIKENPQAGNHNERLEFLGDAVLQLCVTDLLCSLFPECREGDLTRMRHLLVDTDTLAEIAVELDLGSKLRLGLGEEKDGGRQKAKMLANTVEAILGALYQLKGLEQCQRIIQHHFTERAQRIRYYTPPKQILMEWCQQTYKTTPVYRLVETQGPSHNPTFCIGVWINDEHIASGSGSSKKVGTIQAAVAAVKRLRQEGVMEPSTS